MKFEKRKMMKVLKLMSTCCVSVVKRSKDLLHIDTLGPTMNLTITTTRPTRQQCIFACIDLGARHVRSMKEQIDERKDRKKELKASQRVFS